MRKNIFCSFLSKCVAWLVAWEAYAKHLFGGREYEKIVGGEV